MTADILFDKIYPVAPQMMKRAIILAFHLVQHENEVKNLEWSHFDQGNSKVSFIRTKTDEPVVIDYSCNPALIDFLNNLIASRRELSLYIICQKSEMGWVPYSHFRSMWNKALNAAGYADGEFKEIRHLANTLMKDANITADKRRAMTGTRQIKPTKFIRTRQATTRWKLEEHFRTTDRQNIRNKLEKY